MSARAEDPWKEVDYITRPDADFFDVSVGVRIPAGFFLHVEQALSPSPGWCRDAGERTEAGITLLMLSNFMLGLN